MMNLCDDVNYIDWCKLCILLAMMTSSQFEIHCMTCHIECGIPLHLHHIVWLWWGLSKHGNACSLSFLVPYNNIIRNTMYKLMVTSTSKAEWRLLLRGRQDQISLLILDWIRLHLCNLTCLLSMQCNRSVGSTWAVRARTYFTIYQVLYQFQEQQQCTDLCVTDLQVAHAFSPALLAHFGWEHQLLQACVNVDFCYSDSVHHCTLQWIMCNASLLYLSSANAVWRHGHHLSMLALLKASQTGCHRSAAASYRSRWPWVRSESDRFSALKFWRPIQEPASLAVVHDGGMQWSFTADHLFC